MHADSDYNMGYLLPSLYLGVGSDKHGLTTLLQQVEASVLVISVLRFISVIIVITIPKDMATVN